MKLSVLIWALILPFLAYNQNIAGIWEYEVLNTLSGDYYGELIIKKKEDRYKGEIISRGETYDVNFNFIDNDSISIFSNVEGFLATIKGNFVNTEIIGEVTVLGDPNIYKFNAKRKPKDQILKVINSRTNEVVSYANIIYGNEGTITNEDGLCKIKGQQKEVIISAIGYKMDTIKLTGKNEIEIIRLHPVNYSLPLVEVKAKGFSAEKIVEAAITKLKDNYLQKPYNANLFYRHSSLNKQDSLVYQSESILKFYDSKGYRKRGWRNVASSRYAKLEQARITVGKQEKKMELQELGKIFVFWSHEPIVTNDKPLSKNSINAYDYKLVGVKKFMGKDVFDIEFVCTKLKSRFAGLSSLKYMKGRIYINKEDYAIIRYEHEYLMDYEFSGKHPKKRGNLNERTIINSLRIEIFSKNPDGYYLSYAKENNRNERQNTLLNGKKDIRKGSVIKEYQFFDITTDNVESLNENLFKINDQTKYNPDYWKQFNVVLNNK